MKNEDVMTSESHPIYVDFVPEEHTNTPGRLGMTFAPGMKTLGMRGRWDRDLMSDLRALREEYRADVLVSVMEEHEYGGYGIPELFEHDLIEGIEILRFAIEDMNVPKEAEAKEYEALIKEIVRRLKDGENVVVHCRGGLGRTGTVAACVLVALGRHTADEAIDAVRDARKGTVQTRDQEEFVSRFEDTLHERERVPVRLEDLHSLSPKEDRRVGAILGLAVGDALGATYEFCTPDEVPEGPLNMAGGGWLGLEPGETTDDTALTRAVLIGYEDGSLDLRRVRDEMLSWQDTDPKDIGNQTRKALDYLRSHPDALSLPEDPDAQGNGAVMRAAAHGVKARDANEAVENAWREAGLTHPSWECRASSALVAALVAHLGDGKQPEEALEHSFSLLEAKDETGKRVRETLRPLEDYEHSPGGWTIYTTRLAVLGLLDATEFRSGVETVIRLGGDADTNGAVAGALLGARFGASVISLEWLRGLEMKEELLALI